MTDDGPAALRAMADAAFEGIALHQNERILHVNDAFATLFGYERRELQGMSPLEIVSPESRAMVREKIASQSQDPYTATGLRKDRSTFLAEVRGRRTRLRGRRACVAAVRDVTESARAQGDLRRSVSLLAATVESTTDGILVVDRNGRIVLFNQRFKEMFRIPDDVLAVGSDERALDYVLDQLAEPDAFLRRVRELYGQPAACSSDTVHFQDGRVYERYSQPQRLGGEYIGRVWGFDDITERARADRERDQLYREATHNLQARDEFLSIAAHELYTPLTALKLALQTLQRGLLQGTPAAVERVRVLLAPLAERQAQRLIMLVDELLDVTRLSNGALHLSPELLELGPVTQEVVQRLGPLGDGAGSTLDMEIESAVRGWWDRSRLDQVITNLIANAIKYGAGKPIGIRVWGDDQRACLAVEDHGIGIPEEHLGRIFGRFERTPTAGHYSGLGLGLFISKRIVDALAGSISVTSRPGEGSTFTLQLPIRPPATAAGQRSEAPQRSLRIAPEGPR
jgi:PAS domain S-box-containing protein